MNADVGQYVLDGKVPVREPNLMVWGVWMEVVDRHVGWTRLEDGRVVSTVFLGLDHAFGCGPPVLFETMVRLPEGGWKDVCERYTTWDEAEAGHWAVVEEERALP